MMNSDGYRQDFLSKHAKQLQNKSLKVDEYAKYLVDYQTSTRNKLYATSKKTSYGFGPIGPICYVSNDGNVVTKIFELNSINHFLIGNENSKAVDAAKCILLAMYDECKKDIQSFDPVAIEAAMSKIEQDYKNNSVKEESNEH